MESSTFGSRIVAAHDHDWSSGLEIECLDMKVQLLCNVYEDNESMSKMTHIPYAKLAMKHISVAPYCNWESSVMLMYNPI